MKQRWKKYSLYVVISLLLFVLLVPMFLTTIGFPQELQLVKGHKQLLEIDFPFPVYIQVKKSKELKINGQRMKDDCLKVDLSKPLAIKSAVLGKVNLEFNLFGFIPIRQATVNVIPRVKVYPGGQSVGIILKSKGVLVVKKSYVLGSDNKKYYPANSAGVKVGDRILAVNGQRVKGKNSLSKLINYYGRRQKRLKLKIRRNGSIITRNLKPKKNHSGQYMLGLYIDDGATGVGTMTFYDPHTKMYGALGHMITEPNSRSRMPISEGKIVKADISGIQRGHNNLPGEKLGTFFDNQKVMGKINKNDKFGIYGRLSNSISNKFFSEPIPVATALQVNRGPAKIYTVVEGNRIEEFKVQIVQVMKQYHPHEKGLIVKVTDHKLLNKTGGIIQGMSGSPIVQDGKLIGAVTHVFINDSTKGYGVLAEWMVEKAGLIQEKMAQN